MNTEQPTQANNSIAKWTLGIGAAGLFGGTLLGLSKGGGLAFAIGMGLPVGIFAALAGAIIGIIIKVASR